MAKEPAPLLDQMRAHIYDYGWCRANMHIWRNPSGTSDGALRVEKGVVFVTYICENCGSKRHDNVSLRSGELLARRYDYAQAYELRLKGSDVSERPKKDDWRKIHFTTLVRGGWK